MHKIHKVVLFQSGIMLTSFCSLFAVGFSGWVFGESNNASLNANLKVAEVHDINRAFSLTSNANTIRYTDFYYEVNNAKSKTFNLTYTLEVDSSELNPVVSFNDQNQTTLSFSLTYGTLASGIFASKAKSNFTSWVNSVSTSENASSGSLTYDTSVVEVRFPFTISKKDTDFSVTFNITLDQKFISVLKNLTAGETPTFKVSVNL